MLARLSGRDDVRNDSTKYEAVCLSLINPGSSDTGGILSTFPKSESPLLLEKFFQTIYRQYDQRFVFAAPGLASKTRRLEWDADSVAVSDTRISDYRPRVMA